MLNNVINKLKERKEYFKNIKNGTDIPIMFVGINTTKSNRDKNCIIHFHPNILNQSSDEDMNYVKEHLGLVIDKIRDNIDFKNNCIIK